MQAILDDVMEQLLFMDGTLWEAAPPPTGLRPVALELVHTLVAVQARRPALLLAVECVFLLQQLAHSAVLLCLLGQVARTNQALAPPGLAQAELAATAPALLAEAVEELLLGTLDGWAQASRAAGGNPGF